MQAFIFSKKSTEIADLISNELHRGVTVLDGQGWYTKAHEKVLLVVIRKTESAMLLSLIRQVDRDAFISIGSVMGVYGQGFDKIKDNKQKK